MKTIYERRATRWLPRILFINLQDLLLKLMGLR